MTGGPPGGQPDGPPGDRAHGGGGGRGAGPVLPLVPFGRTSLRVTRLVFGGAPIGGLFAAVGGDTALETLEAAWAAGIRAFDTAPQYGAGLAQQPIGSFLAGRPRQENVLSTEVGRLLAPTAAAVE